MSLSRLDLELDLGFEHQDMRLACYLQSDDFVSYLAFRYFFNCLSTVDTTTPNSKKVVPLCETTKEQKM